ncbi:hypothetical protein HHO41_02645 [Bacillus sp. DNRA2]|uniref:hypothetical protein n=1 Tax=Bacillus sp. DNRA2 TaxID=2723053 RepID=UPI00145C7068|nr:hypothetical protein [Bacillus sp. DNRA2]NMD69172.1 hypothetical protein [Bacillus sp. DNRA2]
MLISILYTFLVGIPLIIIFMYTNDLLFGEKRDKQLKKLEKRFAKQSVIKIEVLDHEPKKFTIFQVKTKAGTEKIKMKPGYKIIKLVKKKK